MPFVIGSRTLVRIAVLVFFAFAGGAQTTAQLANSADFYVATDGNDSWSGRLDTPNAAKTDGPFATLERARDAVRDLSKNVNRDVTVFIRGGTYRLTKTVVFSLEDSAKNSHTATYAAYPSERPVFSSGQPVRGWRRLDEPPKQLPATSRGRVWIADVSDFGKFRSLYDSQGRLPRARGDGFSQTNSTPRGSQDYQTVQFPAGAVKRYANLKDIELRVVPSRYWIMNLLPIESIDETTRTIKTSVPGTYPLGRNGMTDRDNAWIENALEVLDKPGEWVLDSTQGLLYLWPRNKTPGDDILVPTLAELIRVEGRIDYDGPQDQPVEGLAFQGLTFTQGDCFPWHGRTGWGLQHDWECFDKPTALMRFRGAERCVVEDCEFTESSHAAIRLDLHCQQIRIVGNHVHKMGGVGVLLAGYGPGTKDVNRGNTVMNNYIHHIGQQYWGSGAIFAWQSGENHIAHNHISHIPYTAIVATGRISRTPPGPGECSRTIRWDEVPEEFRQWPWKKREPYLHSRKNIIEYNNIHHAMEVLGDGNCIYVSGAGGGNVVRSNYCHHCYGDYMNAVIRCDDDQHETLMEGNVCFRTGGFGEGFISKGDNDIVNNVVADLQPASRHRGYIVFPYGDIHGTTIERNILYSGRKDQILFYHSQGGSRHGGPPRLSDAQTDRNVYFCTCDANWADDLLKAQRAIGQDTHSIQADPQFVDLDGGDFRLKPGSPAAKLGIKPLDTSKTGLQPEYRKRFFGRLLTTRIAPSAQVLRQPLNVTISCNDVAAEIRYTLDGSEPTRSSNRYESPFTLDRPTTVQAKSFADNATDAVGASVTFAAPPQPIVEDFESAPVGMPTPKTTTAEDAKLTKYVARVSTEQAAGGQRSLKLTDGPGQKAPFTPHVYYRCRFDEGRLIGRFDIRIDATSSLYYQWRQYDKGYKSGPTVTILPGGVVTHKGKNLLQIPTNEWVRFEVSCDVGEKATGTFQMRVWLPGAASPSEFQQLQQDPEFQRLDWFGFASKAEEDCVYYIDNIELIPVATP